VTGIAFDPADGHLRAVTTESKLLTIDAKTATVTNTTKLLGLSGKQQTSNLDSRPTDVSFDSAGNLYVVGRRYLALVDKSSGRVVKFLAKVKSKEYNFQALAFDHVNNRLLGADLADRSLYQMHIESNKAKKLGKLTYPKVAALSFVPGEGISGTKVRIVEWLETSRKKK